jgi:glutaredoxin
MEKHVAVFTMKGCPFCDMMKNQLKEHNIDFIEMDIDENEEEYDIFSKITENEFVPAFMLMEIEGEEQNTNLFAPGRDYEEISDGVKIIREFYSK